MDEQPEPLTDAEDRKLVTLARATRARARAPQGAAMRDLDGRTYAAATVDLPGLAVSAIAGTLVMALSSGAAGVEAVVVLGPGGASDADLEALRGFAGAGVAVHEVDPSGAPIRDTTT